MTDGDWLKYNDWGLMQIIEKQPISGGEGNGNGELDPGEKAVFYVILPKGNGTQ